ncbi:MAG: hypothetical protein KIT11_05345 [Fimbriimonadaceae bacterium]|nr:hypothetical protein [Fimbriimonadaceae bacterium]QYK56683.1 MAG: hypothetical protein KF733_04175 [Fimbriimonadaceae bacterium]
MPINLDPLDGWFPFGVRSNHYDAVTTGMTGGTTFHHHAVDWLPNYLPEPIEEIVLVYGNYTKDGTTNSEVATANAVRVKAALQTMVPGNVDDFNDAIVKCAFDGDFDGARIAAGAIRCTDPVPFFVAPGERFRERVSITPDTGGSARPNGGSVHGGTAEGGRGYGDGYVDADRAYSGDPWDFRRDRNIAYNAIACLVRTPSRKRYPTVMGYTDSIGRGAGDAGWGRSTGGYVRRACIGRYGALVHGYGAEKLSTILSRPNRGVRDQMARFCTHVLCHNWRNDLASLSATQIIDNIVAFCAPHVAAGRNVILGLALPGTTSSDGWVTVANQSYTTADETKRQAVNNAGREGSISKAVMARARLLNPAGSLGRIFVWDPCEAVEVNKQGVLALNGGYWKPAVASIVLTGTAGAGTTTTALTLPAGTYATDQFRGMVVVKGAESRTVWYSDSTKCYFADGFTSLAQGDTFSVRSDVQTQDGVHPASPGHDAVGTHFQSFLSSVMT